VTAKPERLLDIYLNDHLAGSTLGVELARRLAANNESEPAFGRPLAEIAEAIEADRKILEEVMELLEIRRGVVKPAGAWTAEKLGRFKLNGQLAGYSPLSRVAELEMLYIGLTGQIRMWRALARSLRGVGKFDFAKLAERAGEQRNRVGDLHLAAAARAFDPGGGAAESELNGSTETEGRQASP
jgi:hypothetical protein